MRIAFLIDGFNLYHSIKDVIADGHATARLKWLDIPDLCSGIVRDCPAIPRVGKVESVHYFTAFAKHLESRSPASLQASEQRPEGRGRRDLPDPSASIREAPASRSRGDECGRRAALSRFLVQGRLRFGSS
jgi:hypothetical protein